MHSIHKAIAGTIFIVEVNILKTELYNRIVKIGLEVDDMESSLSFYNQKCGMPILDRFPQPDGGECVFLDAGTVILELMTPKEGDGQLHHIALGVEDVVSASDYFREINVPVTMEPIIVEQNINLADVRDPDDIRVRLFHREG